MYRLNEYGKAWRDYLYALDGLNEAVERDIEDFETRISLIDDSKEDMISEFLSDVPDIEIIEDCKKEIQYQKEQLLPMIKEYSEYCKDIGLEELEPEDVLSEICNKGSDSELFIILSEWKEVAKAAHNIWHNVSNRYGGSLDCAKEDFCKAFMDEMYENRTVRNLMMEKRR